MKILLTGGGTGGHIFPLAAVAKRLREKIGSELELLYVGSGAPLEKEVMAHEGIRAKFVKSAKIRRYASLENFFDLWKLPVGFLQALWTLLFFMPDAVFSKGGYVSIPVVVAAWLYRIPVFIHESDAVPGMANQFLSKFAKRIGVAYPSAEEYFPKDKVAFVGNPIRNNIATGDGYALRQKLGFTESRKVILVLGGSQGSQAVNEAIVKILPKLLHRAQIIHQTGEQDFERVVHFAAEQGIKAGHEGYYPVKFLDEGFMRDAYALCDMVISRAGANTISEIAANSKPVILIPLEGSANDHQRMNAYALAKIGAAIVLEENNLGEHLFLEKVDLVLNDENLHASMAEKIRTFHHENATEKIANGVIELAAA